jgi:hypothetical protein
MHSGLNAWRGFQKGLEFMNQPPDTELDAEDIKVWNEIWNDLHKTHYVAFYEELCAEHSVRVWRRVETVVKALQMATASGSAIAGWALWTQEGLRTVWVCVAGIAAIASLVHVCFNISDKIKEDTLVYSRFKYIRLQAERLCRHMKIRAYERLSDYKRDYMDLVKEHDAASASRTPDFLLRQKTEETIQKKLNKIIGSHEQ